MCECVGLESVDGRVAAAKGLGVTVTNGWMVPREEQVNDYRKITWKTSNCTSTKWF